MSALCQKRKSADGSTNRENAHWAKFCFASGLFVAHHYVVLPVVASTTIEPTMCGWR
jgi:hypothetical protein